MLCVCYSQNVSWILCCDSTTFLMLLSHLFLSFQIWPCCSTPSSDCAGRADGEASLEAEWKPSWEILSWTSHVLLHLSCRYGCERLVKFSEQNYCLIKSVSRLCQIPTSQCLWNVQPWPAKVTIPWNEDTRRAVLVTLTSLHPTSYHKGGARLCSNISQPRVYFSFLPQHSTSSSFLLPLCCAVTACRRCWFCAVWTLNLPSGGVRRPKLLWAAGQRKPDIRQALTRNWTSISLNWYL